MTKANFEGDLTILSSKQIKFISDVLHKKGFQDGKVTVKPVGEAGDNFLANVIRVTAEKDGKSLRIIGKIAPKIEQLRITMNTRIMFSNEHVMYNDILPKFTELEGVAGLPQAERFRYAICFGCLMEEGEELILLEDLAAPGFIMLDKFKPLTHVEIKLVLKNFARLHSLSFALKYQAPDTYCRLKNNLVDFWGLPQVGGVAEFFLKLENDFIQLCESKYKKYISGTCSKIYDIGNELRNFDGESSFSVIQQGDSWTNNILFKFQEDKAISCCIIDYQLSRENSPVADILYLLFNCTDHEARKEHFIEWIDYYHNELEDTLQEFGLKVNNVYPRDQLDADLKRHAKFSLSMSMLVISTVTRDVDSAKEFISAIENLSDENNIDGVNQSSMGNLNEKTKMISKSRIEDVIETCLQFELL